MFAEHLRPLYVVHCPDFPKVCQRNSIQDSSRTNRPEMPSELKGDVAAHWTDGDCSQRSATIQAMALKAVANDEVVTHENAATIQSWLVFFCRGDDGVKPCNHPPLFYERFMSDIESGSTASHLLQRHHQVLAPPFAKMS